MSRSGTHRGVALLLTLVVTFFLMVLLAAFFVINKSNNSLTVNGLKRQQAYNACISGLHYAWSELEANQYWGSEGFPENTTVPSITVRMSVPFRAAISIP